MDPFRVVGKRQVPEGRGGSVSYRCIRSIETNSNPVTPAVCTRIQYNPIGEGVGVARGDGGNMILVSVDDGKDFQRGLLEGICHRFAYLGPFRIGPGGCNCDIQRPDLPADFFFASACQTTKPQSSTTTLLLEELDG